MSSWQDLDTSQAFEDAMILASLLALVREPSELENAFKTYDKVRQPRRQEISKLASSVDNILRQTSGMDIDSGNLERALSSTRAYINGLDMETYKKEALEVYEKLCEKKSL